MTNKTNVLHNVMALILTGTIVSVPSMVMAQDEDSHPNHERIINHFDQDGDGVLNDREKLHARKYFARKNGSGDGSADRPDRRRPDVNRPDVRPDRNIRDHLDRNNDGQLGQRKRQTARRIQARRNQ
jgi:hypothetical protein